MQVVGDRGHHIHRIYQGGMVLEKQQVAWDIPLQLSHVLKVGVVLSDLEHADVVLVGVFYIQKQSGHDLHN